MFHELTQRELREMSRQMESILSARINYTVPLMLAITGKWMSELDPGAIVVLLWIINRTILHGKAADRITLREFLEGINDSAVMQSGPIRMSRGTLIKHIQTLVDEDFLQVYRVGGPNAGFADARLFAIDCKKILEVDGLEGLATTAVPRIAEAVKRESEAKTRAKAVKKLNQGVQNLDGVALKNIYINNIDSCISSGLAIANLYPPVCDTAEPTLMQVGNTMAQLPEPKRARTPIRATQNQTIAEVLAFTNKGHQERQLSRAAAAVAKPAEMTMLSLQALLDKTMKATRPDFPRMIVTGKAFSVFRKRIAQAQIKDLKDFLVYVIGSWSMHAARNQKAALRNSGRSLDKSYEALPTAPDFQSLAFRLPYFVKIYANHLADKTVGISETAEAREVAELKAQLARAKQETKNREAIIARLGQRTRPISKPVTSRPTRQPGQNQQPDDDTWDLPAWQEGK